MGTLISKGIRTGIIGAIAVLGLSGTAGAADHKINKMVYKNNGAYEADFYIRYNYNGKKCQVREVNNYRSKKGSRTVRVDLTGFLEIAPISDADAGCLVKGKIPKGVEVWGKVNIAIGDRKSCRKDGTKFYFDAKDGGTVKYRSGGTTMNNNRCKISGITE